MATASEANPEGGPSPAELESEATEFVAMVREAIEARLATHLVEAEARAARAGEAAVTIQRALGELIQRGGKRIRPAFLVAAYRACAVGDEAKAIPPAVLDAGCAWELLQGYFLVHDDWMDGDAVRRGGPTVHVALAGKHGGDAHLGAASAILAGDLSCAIAHRVLIEAEAPPAVLREAMACFARVHEDVVLGQSIDLTLGAGDVAAVERMHALKTASYTVRGPLAMGAILAGAGAEPREALDRYARAIGLAFQLRDDLLGTFGDPRVTGKPVGRDLRARKRTALIAEALRFCTDADRTRLTGCLARGFEDRDVAWAMLLFEACGARAAVEMRIEMLVEQGRAALSEHLPPQAARLLMGLARLVAVRRS